MRSHSSFFQLLSPVVLALPLSLAACSSDPGTTMPNVSGAGASSAGAAGSAGSSTSAGAPSTSAGAGGQSTAGAAGSSSAAGAGGAAGASTGAGGASGAAGAGGGSAGAAGANTTMWTGPTGKSTGCGKDAPSVDKVGSFVKHEIHLKSTIDPAFLPNGKDYDHSGVYDFTFRPYTVRLPTGYDPTKAYSVIFGGGGCGGNATDSANNPGAGYDIDKPKESIFVGLPYVAGCFADGGGGTSNLPNTPEVPFVHEVLAEVKANYCVDQSRVFITGHSSGGWESFTVGCALANEIRGIAPVSGGLRNHRPACTGPQASIMTEGLGDTANPIGPLVPPDGSLDSGGSAPARDEILKRNGCVAADFNFTYTKDNTAEAKAGNAPHTAWDPMYPACVQYTGCPAAFPVVWCALPGGHETDNVGNLSYIPAMLKFLDALPSH